MSKSSVQWRLNSKTLRVKLAPFKRLLMNKVLRWNTISLEGSSYRESTVFTYFVFEGLGPCFLMAVVYANVVHQLLKRTVAVLYY